jgi:hypothetical protein
MRFAIDVTLHSRGAAIRYRAVPPTCVSCTISTSRSKHRLLGPLGRGAAESVHENARGTAHRARCSAAPSQTATLLPPSGGATDLAASDARYRTRCVFSHVPPGGWHLPHAVRPATIARPRATGGALGESDALSLPPLRQRRSTSDSRH